MITSRVRKGLRIVVTAGVLGFAVLAVALWVERGFAVTLPVPTGPFAVGRAIYDWKDEAHADPVAPVAGTKRELMVWIWYPAVAGAGAKAEYVPVQMRTAIGPDGGPLGIVTRDTGKVQGHSFSDAEVASQERSYPVAIMRTGASLQIWNYSTLAEDLASHGYVVVGFDAPYRTSSVAFPDGRVLRRAPENNPEFCEEQPPAQLAGCVNPIIDAWIGDIGFVLDRLAGVNASAGMFAGRLDLARVGVFGHSFGGATAAQFCHDDARCKAGIDLDGQPFGSVVQEGMRQPFLFVLGDEIRGSDPETRRIAGNIQSIYDRLPVEGRLRVVMHGANHFLYNDEMALRTSHILMGGLRMVGLVGMEGRRQLAVAAYCVRSFFDEYLKGAGGGALRNAGATGYPEIQVTE